MTTAPRPWRWAAPAAAALLFFPVALAGLAALGLAVAALLRLPAVAWRGLRRNGLWLGLLLAWLALSVLWSPADWGERLGHWGRYALLGFVAVLAAAVDRQLALQAWRVFIAAAAAYALLLLLGAARWVPADGVLASMFHYTGNKSISNGALLALASAAAVHLALQPQSSRLARAGLVAAAVLAAAALVLHGASRTGLALLAGLAATLWLIHWRRWQVAAAMAVAAAVAVSVLVAGWGGLSLRQAAGQLDDSSRYRLVLYQDTLQMIAERPLLGHGVGSWPARWAERDRGPALQAMSTAHQEWLQVAQQGGVGAALLLLLVFAGWGRQAWRAGTETAGGLAVLALAAWLMQTLVNAAIRDAAFAAPMILLTGLALALAAPAAAATDA